MNVRNHQHVVATGIILISALNFLVVNVEAGAGPNEAKAKKFLDDLETEYSRRAAEVGEASWNYSIDMTDANAAVNAAAQNEFAKYSKRVQDEALGQFPDWKNLKDPSLRRQFKYLTVSGPGNVSEKDVTAMSEIGSEMDSVYSKATVCEYKNPTKCDLHLDPEITKKLEESEDPEEMAYYWNEWHDTISKSIKATRYKEFVDYLNNIASANGFKTTTDSWMSAYDAETPGWTPQKFIKDMGNIWEQIRPKYNILYAYIRMRLRSDSPFKDHIQKCGKIPIHLTGNMWGQDWTKFDKYAKPFPNAPSLHITPMMKKMNYTVPKMFKVADEFIQSLGLLKMTKTFWEKSVFERPKGRDLSCHPTASDMNRGKGSEDFRIKMCTEIDMKDLITIHHEMGHIEYYHQYTNLPIIFRDGANPGFHEAIGDVLGLAVTTPQHLQCILGFDLGLNLNCKSSGPSTKPPVVTEADLNHLFIVALDKMAVVPFSVAVDTWRFEAFDGKIQPHEYNKRWWEIREKYQGFSLPNPRDDTKFDPAAKYHISSNTEYLRYFFSNIVQFSMYEAMCKAAGEYDPTNPNSKPLYQCDFNGNKEAGKLLGNLLRMGFKEPWPVPLKIMTGHDNLRADAFLHYFDPLFTKLEQDLKTGGEWECLSHS